MRSVCVITAGGSGMGLATARLLGKEHKDVSKESDEKD